MTHWINAEYSKYRRKKVVEKAKVTLKHVPRDLKKLILKCPKGHKFTPNFLEKRNITPFFLLNDGGYFQQQSCRVKCPACSDITEVSLPVVEYVHHIDVFGDEAFRTIDNKTVFVYSFISFSGATSDKNRFEEEFINIKKTLSPEFNPSDWVLHMTELLHRDKRKLNEKLSHLSEQQVTDAILKIIGLIKVYNDKHVLQLFSSISMIEAVNLKKHQKILYHEEVYASALFEIISLLTSKGLAPKFYFERTGNDGWAKNLFDGGRITLLWPWVTHCLPVMSPKFVNPSYSLYLEIVDIVSYVVARHLFCIGRRVEGSDIETKIPTSLLGKVRYTLTDARGNWNHYFTEGFPDSAMFKGTSWGKFI